MSFSIMLRFFLRVRLRPGLKKRWYLYIVFGNVFHNLVECCGAILQWLSWRVKCGNTKNGSTLFTVKFSYLCRTWSISRISRRNLIFWKSRLPKVSKISWKSSERSWNHSSKSTSFQRLLKYFPTDKKFRDHSPTFYLSQHILFKVQSSNFSLHWNIWVSWIIQTK